MNKRGTILVAEDNVGLLRALTERLQASGFQVIAVQDGYQALERCRREKPDIMLMDVNMPAGTGMSVQERMRANADLACIPVVYMTGDKRESLTARAEELGAAALIYKPIDCNELLGILDGLFDRMERS
jgi:DNA-binding response OmpR family regulator